MAKQVVVIGLGRFGMSLVRALAARGVEVLAVDRDAKRIDEAAEHAAEAVRLDATVEEELAQTQPANRDLCICAIGDESREASIICTALLRQMGAKRVVARANTKIHGRILKLVGAHEVVNPLEEYGERFADRFAYERLKGDLPLGRDLVIAEVKPPEKFIGKTLAELKLPTRFGVTIVATREKNDGPVILPSPDQQIREGDIMIVVARKGAVERLVGGD
jgi:trk system potassium uptake protein TrkA